VIDLPTVGITIMLPFATPSQNAYQRWHWRRRSELRDTCQMIIRVFLRVRPLPQARAPYRATVSVLRLGKRMLDYGNLVGGCKPVLDALVREGVIRDDSPRWVAEQYNQDKAPRGVEATRLWVYPTVER
jgi:hypothetical protein